MKIKSLNMKFKKISGTGVALITPFDKNDNVDYKALQRLVNHVIDGGVNFVVALGTTAETATLTTEEKQKVLDAIYETVDKRVGFVVGAGGNNTREVIDYISHLDSEKVDAILSVAPYYNKPNQRGIYAHFEAIAKSTDLPIILYNVPGRTSSNILPETILKLAKEFENIIAVKEASGNMSQIMDIIQKRPKNFLVLSGDDALTLPMLAVGGDGVISVVANAYPRIFSSMVDEMVNGGDRYSALRSHYQLLDITNSLFEDGNPAGIKALLEIMGICENKLRLPLVCVKDSHYKSLKMMNSKMF